MTKDVDQPDEVTAIVDALAAVDAELPLLVVEAPALDEWCKYASRVINQAVAVILEQASADRLQTAMIDLLQGLHARAIEQRDHWKANHDNQVQRARVLVERPDMPLERIQAYANYRAAADWALAVDNELVTIGSTADSFASPREAINALISWHVAVALDPAVSKDAQALIDRGARVGVMRDFPELGA